MKLGIVSDIHCNAAGLRQALALMGDVDDLICLGDSIYEYRFSNEFMTTSSLEPVRDGVRPRLLSRPYLARRPTR